MSSRFSPKPKKPIVNDIVIYSDFGCNTGFSEVTSKLIDYWSKKTDKKYRIHVFSLSDMNTSQWKYNSKTWVYPANLMPFANQNDGFQLHAFLEFLARITPTVVFFINDLEVVGKISKDLELLNQMKKQKKQLQFKTVFYFPIDSAPRKDNLQVLKTFDEIATYTKYGQRIILDAVPELETKLKVVPHAVDTEVFYPIEQPKVKKHKEKLFGKDKIVFGTVNRNSARKDLSTIILAFKKLKDNYANVESIYERLVLYMHCNPTDAAGVNLSYLCLTIGLEEGKDVFFPKEFSENKGVDKSELNLLYNCMDVFVTTTTAEGWGMTVTEAMATETLVIAPQHTSLSEILLSDNLRGMIIPHSELEQVVFVHDGSKIRYKSKVSNIENAFNNYMSLVNEEAKQLTIKNAKDYIQSLSWSKSADDLWELISKHLL